MELPTRTIIAAGPVIIEDGKVLLDKETKGGNHVTPWYFPGGEVEDFSISLEETAKREAMEELNIEIEIVKPLRTMIQKRPDNRLVILVHYLAKRHGEIKPGQDIVDWGWHDIKNLPADCAPNVYKIIADYLKNNAL